MKILSADDRLLFCDGMSHIHGQSQDLTHRTVQRAARKSGSGGVPHG